MCNAAEPYIPLHRYIYETGPSLVVFLGVYQFYVVRFFFIGYIYPHSGRFLVDGPDLKLFMKLGLGWSFFVCCLANSGSTGDALLLKIFRGILTPHGCAAATQHVV